MLFGVGSLGKVCPITFSGRIAKKTPHERIKIMNHGSGLS